MLAGVTQRSPRIDEPAHDLRRSARLHGIRRSVLHENAGQNGVSTVSPSSENHGSPSEVARADVELDHRGEPAVAAIAQQLTAVRAYRRAWRAHRQAAQPRPETIAGDGDAVCPARWRDPVVQSFDVCIGRQPAVVVEQLATSIAGGVGATPLGPRSRPGCRTRGGDEDEDRQQGGREPAHRDRNAPAWRLIYTCLPPRRVPKLSPREMRGILEPCRRSSHAHFGRWPHYLERVTDAERCSSEQVSGVKWGRGVPPHRRRDRASRRANPARQPIHTALCSAAAHADVLGAHANSHPITSSAKLMTIPTMAAGLLPLPCAAGTGAEIWPAWAVATCMTRSARSVRQSNTEASRRSCSALTAPSSM
jgi:hypothetical protein